MRSFILILLFSLSGLVFAQEQRLELRKWSGSTTDENAVFTTRGSNIEATKTFYRVYFLVYEVYYSLLIEEMSYSGIENSDVKSKNKSFITGYEIASKFPKLLNLTNLRFINWVSPTSFIIDENGTNLKINIKPQREFTVEKVN